MTLILEEFDMNMMMCVDDYDYCYFHSFFLCFCGNENKNVAVLFHMFRPSCS